MNNYPLITVGITSYREGEYLKNAWESLESQSSNNWEAVMVLDGGADRKTRHIFETIKHPNLKKITQMSNMGPYHCRTLAIENAETPWYFHLDADDLLPQDSIKLVVEYINKYPRMDYFWGKCLFFSEKKYFVEYVEEVNHDLQARYNLILGTSPIKISMFNELNGFHKDLMNGGADWEFWIRVLSNGNQGKFINKILYERQIRQNSVGDKWRLRHDKVAEIIIENNPDFFMKNNRKKECLGRSYELISRQYRKMGNRKKAAKYAQKAQNSGWEYSSRDAIIKEINMSIFRYTLRRLGKLL